MDRRERERDLMQMNMGSCRGRGLNPGGMKFGPTDPFLIQKLRFCELILLGGGDCRYVRDI